MRKQISVIMLLLTIWGSMPALAQAEQTPVKLSTPITMIATAYPISAIALQRRKKISRGIFRTPTPASGNATIQLD